jgi:serine/threonine protein kinase/class 3 adenylate cyclase
MLDHPAALSICELSLDCDPPYLVLEWVEAKSLAAALQPDVPLPGPAALQIGESLASVLVAAHRLGLSQRSLWPGAIGLTDAGDLKIDFTGMEARTPLIGESAPEIDAACHAPEQAQDTAADIYGLGAILFWLITGCPAPVGANGTTLAGAMVPDAPWKGLLPRLLALDPAERPSARAVADYLGGQQSGEVPTATLAKTDVPLAGAGVPAAAADRQAGYLGRFRLLEKQGEGGLGAVYRAEDTTDGTVVAIKLLQARWDTQPQALRRLRKEARLLAEIKNPYVANLIEMNEADGVPYLVLEFVNGKSVAALLAQQQRLDERLAVAIMADVARALVDAHQRGIVHRDIKPSNILLVDAGASSNGDKPESAPRVKLCDFGLARHVLQTESLNVTQEGTPLGTPFYAAPEQCAGQGADARSDVYSMGATLFHLLAGRPPFQADTPLALGILHTSEPPPQLQRLNPAVSDAVCGIVSKALAKPPESRYPDAEALLRDLERVLRGEPTSIVVHPRLPACEPKRLSQFDWTWELAASPRELWPYVSNTDRFNRAVGIPAVEFSASVAPSGAVHRFGRFRKAGVTNVWREHPFEWIEGQRMAVLREYSEGVFRWLATTTEIKPRVGGGTVLTHRVRIEPRNWLGRFVATVEVGVRGRRLVERAYRRIDAFVSGKLSRAAGTDPFEEPGGALRTRRRRVDPLLDRLVKRLIDPLIVEQLGEFLVAGADQEVARIRPLVLARRLGHDGDQVVNACLVAAQEGLLDLLWDIVCPVCRIPADIVDTLRALRGHGHCVACNLDFDLDFAQSVELIFRVHPAIRASDLGTYCIGGPVHSPHVAAQVRVAPGERVELELALAEGAYRLRGPQLPFMLDFRIDASAGLHHWDLPLSRAPDPAWPRQLGTGRQVLTLTNDQPHELVARVERCAPRHDAVTAARASSLALFRELFPTEVLSPGQLVTMATVTLLLTDLDQVDSLYDRLGDARAFTLLQGILRCLEETIVAEGGAVVKTIGEGLVAAFADPAAAVRAALPFLTQQSSGLTNDNEPLLASYLRLGIHRGPVLAATQNDHLDYFGATVRQASGLTRFARGGEMVLTQAVAGDPQVATLLRGRGLEIEVVPQTLPGHVAAPLHRVALAKRQIG